MKALYIPNLISGLRILMVIPLTWYLWQQNYLVAFGIFFIAGVSDALDGYLARRFNWFTQLGVVLDPMGDKLLMLCSYLILWYQGYLAMWLVITVILRDVIIVTGGVLYRIKIGEIEIKPIYSSKINTVLQILLVVMVLFSLSLYTIPPVIILALMVVVFISTVFSGACYIIKWGKRAWAYRSTSTS